MPRAGPRKKRPFLPPLKPYRAVTCHNVQFSIFLDCEKVREIIQAMIAPEKCSVYNFPPICRRRNELSYSGKIVTRAHRSMDDTDKICPVYVHPSHGLVICRIRGEDFSYYYTFSRGSGGKTHITGVRHHSGMTHALVVLVKTFGLKTLAHLKGPIRINSISGNGCVGEVLALSKPPARPDKFISVRFNREVFPGSFYIIKAGCFDDDVGEEGGADNQMAKSGREKRKAGCLCLFRNGSFCISGIRNVRHMDRVEKFIRKNIMGSIS